MHSFKVQGRHKPHHIVVRSPCVDKQESQSRNRLSQTAMHGIVTTGSGDKGSTLPLTVLTADSCLSQ